MNPADQPFDRLHSAARYPAPDYEGIGTVVRVYVPDDETVADTVGWAVFQNGTALAWLSSVNSDHLGYGIRRTVDQLLRDNARLGVPAAATWARLLADTLHTMPSDDYLPALVSDIRAIWE